MKEIDFSTLATRWSIFLDSGSQTIAQKYSYYKVAQLNWSLWLNEHETSFSVNNLWIEQDNWPKSKELVTSAKVSEIIAKAKHPQTAKPEFLHVLVRLENDEVLFICRLLFTEKEVSSSHICFYALKLSKSQGTLASNAGVFSFLPPHRRNTSSPKTPARRRRSLMSRTEFELRPAQII